MEWRFDPAVLAADPRRGLLLDVLGAGVREVDPENAVRRSLVREGQRVEVAGTDIDLSVFDGVRVIGLGKASVAMATAVESLFRDLPMAGVVVAPGTAEVPRLDVVVGSHPIPDATSVAAAEAMLGAARATTGRDLLIVLISGGGSALATLPVAGVTLEDIRGITSALLRSGADIGEVNTVRKHLSAVKGGRLLEAAGDAGMVITLVLSDVVGNPLDMIASGPTVPDPTTFDQALEILDRYGIDGVSPAVTTVLRRGSRGEIPETPGGGEVFERQIVDIVADAAVAAHAVVDAASVRGISARVATVALTGEAREVGRRVSADAPREPGLVVYAGETTVTVAGRGSGGRNQELALAAGLALEGTADVIVASLGTDGRDGPTTAAGGIGDGETTARALARGIDPVRALADNDSHAVLRATGDLLITGPTGTNVGDVVVVYRAPHRT